MKGEMRVLLCLSILVLVLGALPAEAKGAPEWVRITGATMFRPVEIRDPELLSDLGIAQLEDVESPMSAPDGLRHILHITRGYDGRNGEPIPFDEVLYAFDPDGGRGYVYYLGIVNGSGPYDGKWYRASEAGHRSLLAVLEGAGVNLAAYPVSASPARSGSPSANLAALLVGAAAFAGLSGWAIGRRSLSGAAVTAGEPVS